MDPGNQTDSSPEPATLAVAEYIALEMSRLARLATASGFALLPYLIDIAVLEAWREASEPKTNSHRRRRGRLAVEASTDLAEPMPNDD